VRATYGQAYIQNHNLTLLEVEDVCRAELVSVERDWEDLWVEVKSLSSSVIAGFPRNICKYSTVLIIGSKD